MSRKDDTTYIDHTRQWLEKAVIGLNLCPFAKAPYQKDLVRLSVSHARHLDAFLETLDTELRLLADTAPDKLETTLLIEPVLFDDFLVFNDMLDLAEAAVSDQQLDGIIQIAPFHPQFQFADTESDDVSNFTNRSPYPTLHLIREQSIAKATAAIADPATIFERNIALLHRMGREGWAALNIPNPSKPQS